MKLAGKIRKVLCVCKGSLCRSPMMEIMLQDELERAGLTDIKVESAGIKKEARAGMPADERAIHVMASRNLDLSQHTSRWIGDLDLSQYDLIVCTASQAVDYLKTYSLSCPIKLIDIPNPWRLGLEAFFSVAHQIERALPVILEKYLYQPQKLSRVTV